MFNFINGFLIQKDGTYKNLIILSNNVSVINENFTGTYLIILYIKKYSIPPKKINNMIFDIINFLTGI